MKETQGERDKRVAITENMRIVELLLASRTPHAKELAIIVLERIKSIGAGASVEAASEEQSRTMVAFARQNTGRETTQ